MQQRRYSSHHEALHAVAIIRDPRWERRRQFSRMCVPARHVLERFSAVNRASAQRPPNLETQLVNSSLSSLITYRRGGAVSCPGKRTNRDDARRQEDQPWSISLRVESSVCPDERADVAYAPPNDPWFIHVARELPRRRQTRREPRAKPSERKRNSPTVRALACPRDEANRSPLPFKRDVADPGDFARDGTWLASRRARP